MNHRIDHLRARLRDEPGSRLFFQLGDLLRKDGEVDEAETVLTQGLENHPRYVAAWVSLGRLQLDQAQHSEAERSFTRALELDPENGVAAGLLGETAERIGQWVRAIKAYKLARALMPGDAEIDAGIERVELHLGEGPEELPAEGTEEPFGEPASGTSPPDLSSATATPSEPFALGGPAPAFPDSIGPPRRASRPRTLISMSENDPFAVTSTGEAAIWMAEDDVFALPEVPVESEAGEVSGAAPADEGSILSSEEPGDPVEDLTTAAFPQKAPESEPVQELSLPTVTLARLALEQDDRPLALETLKAVLDLDPENWEAVELLDQLSEDPSPEISEPETSPSSADVLAAKTEALKGWMQNIRGAAERRAP